MQANRDLISIAPPFFGITLVPRQYWKEYGYALLTISGADGEVSDPEMDWLIQDLAKGANVSEDVITAWEEFSFEDADLEEIFLSFNISSTVNFAKVLIYDAIRMASADDEFTDDERESLAEAAVILRLSPEVMLAIEALVDMEKAADKLRVTLF